ncbi:MAG: hypothetical protein ABW199_02885 [Caulobacterales bacterium]
MTEHRIYFIGENGRIVGVDDSAYIEQEEAVNRAQSLTEKYASVEVWCGAECIATIKQERSAEA